MKKQERALTFDNKKKSEQSDRTTFQKKIFRFLLCSIQVLKRKKNL